MAIRFTIEKEIEISPIGFIKDQWYGITVGFGLGFGLCMMLIHRCN